jgi:hypothetical protein
MPIAENPGISIGEIFLDPANDPNCVESIRIGCTSTLDAFKRSQQGGVGVLLAPGYCQVEQRSGFGEPVRCRWAQWLPPIEYLERLLVSSARLELARDMNQVCFLQLIA